jgi:hypothetical protein
MENHEWFDGELEDGLEHITKLIIGEYTVSAVAVEPSAITNGSTHQLIRMGDKKSTIVLVDRDYLAECLHPDFADGELSGEDLGMLVHQVYEFGIFLGQVLSFEAAYLMSENGEKLYD